MIPIYRYVYLYIYIFKCIYIYTYKIRFVPCIFQVCGSVASQDAPSLLRQELVLSAFQRAGAPERTTLGSIFGGDITDT